MPGLLNMNQGLGPGLLNGGGQTQLPRVPWSQNPMVTTAALSLLGGRTLNEGLSNVAQSAPYGMQAKSSMQQFMLERQEKAAEDARRKAAFNAAMIWRSKGDGALTPEQRMALAGAPDIAAKFMPEPQENFRPATPEEAAQYGAAGGQFGPNRRFYAINPPSGMSVEADGQGGFRLVQGPGVGGGKPLTEGQSKDTVFATRAEGALTVLDKVDTALTSFPERVAENDPTGLVRGMQTPEFQQAQQSGLEFLQAILRKDTGAAITPAEQQEYGRVYLPQPGDGPQIIEQKRASRRRALEAIKAGMPPQAILNQEIALQRSAAPPSASPPAQANDPLGIR